MRYINISGYTLDPESAHAVCEYQNGPTISRAREVARENSMGLLLPHGENTRKPMGKRTILTVLQ